MATAQPEPQEPVEARLELAPGVTLPTAEEVESMHQEAWKEGYAAGYEEGSARGRLEAAQLHQLLQSMHEALSHLDQGSGGGDPGALARSKSRARWRTTRSRYSLESVIAVIREASDPSAAARQRNRARQSGLDVALVQQYLGEQFGSTGHRLREDEAVERGGCLVESEGGQIDAQITTRWRRVVESIA